MNHCEACRANAQQIFHDRLYFECLQLFFNSIRQRRFIDGLQLAAANDPSPVDHHVLHIGRLRRIY